MGKSLVIQMVLAVLSVAYLLVGLLGGSPDALIQSSVFACGSLTVYGCNKL